MDEHNSKYPRMDWDAKDLPLAFKSFKEHCNFMLGGPLKSKSEEENANMSCWRKRAQYIQLGH